METYLNAFIRAAQEGKDFFGMTAWLVKSIVEDMLIERDAAIAARDAAIRKESKWISVKEQLPEARKEVLLSGYLYNNPKNGRFTVVDEIENAEYATHWMPLPEPPVGKEGEE